VDLAAWTALGLYDPDAPDAAERLALLEFLDQQGVTPAELAAAEREDRLGSILMERSVGSGTERLTVGDVAERTRCAPELLGRIWRASGFPDPGPEARIFTEEDLEVLATFALATTYFGEEVALQMVRVIGSSMARIADATFRAALVNVDDALFVTASSPLEAVRTSAELLAMLPLAARAMDVLLRRHLQVTNRRFEAQPSGEAADVETPDLVVGFVDLVGFTALSHDLATRTLARAVSEFELLAADLVTSGDGRVVKELGDGVMFVAADVGRGCEIALGLLDALGDHAVLPPLRASLAAGEVVAREGDYFGPVVNLAARMLRLAAPGELLVTHEARARVGDDAYHFEPLGARLIRGFAEPVDLYRVARA